MLKIPTPNIGKISILVAILTWLALLFVDITRIFQSVNQMDRSLAPEISYVLEILFFESRRTGSDQNRNTQGKDYFHSEKGVHASKV